MIGLLVPLLLAGATPQTPAVPSHTGDEFADVRRSLIALNQNPVLLTAPLPEAARQRLRLGQAMLSCRLKANGLMTDCRVAAESHRGMGLGAAAMARSPTLWLRNAYVFQAGRIVEIAFDFTVESNQGYARIGASSPPGVEVLALHDPPPEDSGLAALDLDHDGRLSVAEAQAPDVNRDGVIDKAEFDRVFRTGAPISGFPYYDNDRDGRITWQDLSVRFRPSSIHALKD